MAKGQSLQDPFLNALRKEHVPVSIYLVNGIKLQGQIDSFDQFVVLLKNTVSQMVYKHAISTVVPARAVRLAVEEGSRRRACGRVMRRTRTDGMFERPRAGERAVLVRLGLGAAGQARGSRGVRAAGALCGRATRGHRHRPARAARPALFRRQRQGRRRSRPRCAPSTRPN